MSPLARLAALLVLATLTACSSGAGTKPDALDRMLYDYSGAIRWSKFEVAYGMIDPEVRKTKPLTDFELERLKQVQITRYDVVSSLPLPDGRVAREVELGVVNRHTQAERTVRVRETWRYDEEGKVWWQVEGLPDLSSTR
jgi:uncharacterized lipoprotein